ncbi:SCP2 sterol-binding domain-containing protein [Thermogemmatispora tikiterensis]|nr:SCP2 sterol-binding domain-containing protein [Thermogemmatispora tikiterensis]
MTTAEIFDAMVQNVNPSAASGLNKTFQWNITGDDPGVYAIKLENGQAELIKGGVEKPDLTLTVSDKDWASIVEGKLDPTTAFMTGKIKISGDMMLAMRLQNLFNRPR